ncbi:MAG TPA: histidine kinase [Tenuifilaceae bacterium]|nr:histidine kinase [Tenuifilaceae bacterium]HPJ46610.1 histidine kinase [Tenuifilaceae bacterium]HPQ34954.1 histidine kinase [Tenuifilaceae bacterium]
MKGATKRNKVAVLAITIAFSILFSLFFKWIQTGNPFKAETIVYGLIVFLNIFILGYVGYVTLNKFSNKSTIETQKKIIPAFLLFVILSLIIALAIVSIGVYSFYLIKGLDTSNFINHLFRVELSSAIKQFSIWILLSSAFFFYIIWRKAIEREQQLIVENLKYKYQNLKSQVNPHFLFNSLNTLSEIVYEDSKKADSYIQTLSKIYRYILENEEIDLVWLDKEIEFVKQYFNIQKVRDNDKVSLEIDLKDAGKFKIVPVSLQILVENALKHNSRSEKMPLKIRIERSNDYIVISNNIQRKNILENSSKTGLLNLRERVRLIINKDLIIEDDNNLFIVKIPVIKL